MEELPGRIERMEAEQDRAARENRVTRLLQGVPDDIARALARIDELKDSLHDAYARWDELILAAYEALTRRYAGTGVLRRRVDVRAPVDFRAGGLPAVGAFRVRRPLAGAGGSSMSITLPLTSAATRFGSLEVRLEPDTAGVDTRRHHRFARAIRPAPLRRSLRGRCSSGA